MTDHFPALLVTVPLLCGLVIAILGWLNRKLCFPVAVGALAVSLISAAGILARVLEENVILYRLGGWDPPWGIAYRVDHLNALVLVVVSVSALLNLMATRRSVQEAFQEKLGAFYCLYVLMVTGLLGIVVTGDAFNLYVLLEITALTGYGLIAMGDDRAPLASLNYLYLGTIGACFYLLGIGYLYIATGSLNMADIAAILPNLYGSKVILGAFVLCMVGLWLKMAFFPLHVWLPNAYTHAHAAVSSLVAPLVTKVMIYVMIRLMLTVFTAHYTFEVLSLSGPVVWLSTIGIFSGAILALAAKGFKRMLTYVIVSEVGYMVGGAWLGNEAGMTGAILHIANDALMTLCLFLAAGNIVYRQKGHQYQDLKGLFRKMPLTMMGFMVGGLAIIGVPPTCGFFSKWYLLSGGIEAGHYGFVTALIFSSLVNVILVFRVVETAYYPSSGNHGGHHREAPALEEAPLHMVAPLLLVAAGLVVVGLYTGDLVTRIIQPILETMAVY